MVRVMVMVRVRVRVRGYGQGYGNGKGQGNGNGNGLVVLSCLVVVLGMRVLQHFCLEVHHVCMNHESWSHAALPRKGPQHAHA